MKDKTNQFKGKQTTETSEDIVLLKKVLEEILAVKEKLASDQPRRFVYIAGSDPYKEKKDRVQFEPIFKQPQPDYFWTDELVRLFAAEYSLNPKYKNMHAMNAIENFKLDHQ